VPLLFQFYLIYDQIRRYGPLLNVAFSKRPRAKLIGQPWLTLCRRAHTQHELEVVRSKGYKRAFQLETNPAAFPLVWLFLDIFSFPHFYLWLLSTVRRWFPVGKVRFLRSLGSRSSFWLPVRISSDFLLWFWQTCHPARATATDAV